MKNNIGFTIVELLVVIVIIGILALITFVAYAGVSNRAVVAVIQSDLKNASTQLKMDQAEKGLYPLSLALANDGVGIKSSPGTTYQYSSIGGSQPSYCMAATNNGQSLINQDGTIISGGRNLFQKSATFNLYNNNTDNANPLATYTVDPIYGDYQTFTNTTVGGNRYWYVLMSESRVQGQTYTISLDINTSNNSWRGYWYPSEQYYNIVFPNTGGVWQRWSWTYTQTGTTVSGNRIFGFYNSVAGSSISFRKIKLETGSAATCWVSEP